MQSFPLAALALGLVLGALAAAPQPAFAADLENGDFVVGVRRPDPPYPYPYYLRGGQIVRVRSGVSSVFCDSAETYYTNGFFHNPHDVVLDGQGRVVFLAALGPSTQGTGDGFALWRCDSLGAAPTLLGAFGGGAALGYRQPIGPQAVCHAQGLHIKRVQGVDLNSGTFSSSELYVFAINTGCGSGPYETIAYDPVSDQWIDSFEDPVPTAMAGPLDGYEMDMLNAGGFTWSVAGTNGAAGIRGVSEPLRLSFEIGGVLSGGLVLGGVKDLIQGQPLAVLFDDLTVPNQPANCGPPVHFDTIPKDVPYSHAVGGTKFGPSHLTDVAWRDGGLVIQGGIGRSQVPNINNLALFNFDPNDDVGSMAHDDFSCAHYYTLQFTPWHAFNEYWDSNGISHEVVRMTPDGRFGSQPQPLGRIVSVGPGDVTIHAEGLESPIGIDVYPPFVPSSAGVAVFFKIDSPVNVLITGPDGRRIGADLATGAPINDYGDGGYDSATSEPHIYGVRDPGAGGFVIQARGTGSGPYTITTYGANLATDAIAQAPFGGTTGIGVESVHLFDLDAAGGVTAIPDADGDGVGDASDNCPHAPNPSQSDVGGLGAAALPDGIGDACQCGDVSGNGRVTTADAILITRSLLVPPTATLANPALCDVGGSAGCTPADAVIATRALLAPPTASIGQVCAPALP